MVNKKLFVAIGSTILICLFFICVGCSFFFELYLTNLNSFQVIGNSMYPTLDNGKFVLGTSNDLDNLKRGDLVVYKNSDGNAIISRIIAIEEDQVEIIDGKVFINKNIVDEPYLAPDTNINEGELFENNQPLVVPKNSYFVMGDNRSNSYDSRFIEHGFVEKDSIVTKINYSFPPLKKISD